MIPLSVKVTSARLCPTLSLRVTNIILLDIKSSAGDLLCTYRRNLSRTGVTGSETDIDILE